LQILIWSAALVIVRNSYAHSLIATGHQNLDLRCGIASAVCNVVLNIALIPRFGMVGAATATVTADLVWNAMSYFYFRRAVLSSPPPIRWLPPLLAGAAMAAVLLLGDAIHWIPRAAAATAAYFSIHALYPGTFLHVWLRVKRSQST